MDVKYGYIAGTSRFFFQLSLIDVFDKQVIDYHLVGAGIVFKDIINSDIVKAIKNKNVWNG